MPDYKDAAALAEAETQLGNYPPLVFAGEARALKADLAKVAGGEAFLPPRAATAPNPSPVPPEQHPRHLPRAAADGGRTDLRQQAADREGRADGGGSSPKPPRSKPTEVLKDVELPSYRGDIINDIAFTADGREPDPKRMVQAYNQSAATLNLLRAFSAGGYANLHQVHAWTLDFMGRSPWPRSSAKWPTGSARRSTS